MHSKKTIKSAFESMMFVWGEPLEVRIAAASFDIGTDEAFEYFEELKREYDEQERGIRIREINGKYQFVTNEENFEYIEAICTPVKERRLSQAALEVLAIVAYKQPVTKSEIDSIRGIKSDRVLEGLSRRKLIENLGRSDAIGKPILYGTTDAFLEYFDLNSLRDLPDIEDIEEVIQLDDYEGVYPSEADSEDDDEINEEDEDVDEDDVDDISEDDEETNDDDLYDDDSNGDENSQDILIEDIKYDFGFRTEDEEE